MSQPDFLNQAVLRGRISSDPLPRELPSGSQVLQFDVSTLDPEGHRASVPVSWTDPPAARSEELHSDLEVIVVGWIRRRFFRANGRTQSRTELVADEVVLARRRRTAEKALARLVARVEAG